MEDPPVDKAKQDLLDLVRTKQILSHTNRQALVEATTRFGLAALAPEFKRVFGCQELTGKLVLLGLVEDQCCTPPSVQQSSVESESNAAVVSRDQVAPDVAIERRSVAAAEAAAAVQLLHLWAELVRDLVDKVFESPCTDLSYAELHALCDFIAANCEVKVQQYVAENLGNKLTVKTLNQIIVSGPSTVITPLKSQLQKFVVAACIDAKQPQSESGDFLSVMNWIIRGTHNELMAQLMPELKARCEILCTSVNPYQLRALFSMLELVKWIVCGAHDNLTRSIIPELITPLLRNSTDQLCSLFTSSLLAMTDVVDKLKENYGEFLKDLVHARVLAVRENPHIANSPNEFKRLIKLGGVRVEQPADTTTTDPKTSLEELRNKFDVTKKDFGIMVHASTVGALAVLLRFLRDECKPPVSVSHIKIGDITKKDVVGQHLGAILAFDVKVEVDEETVKKFSLNSARIFSTEPSSTTPLSISDLLDRFRLHYDELVSEQKKTAMKIAIFPCKLEIKKALKNSAPIILLVEVLEGQLRVGSPLCIPDLPSLDIGNVAQIMNNQSVGVDIARKGMLVSIKLEHPLTNDKSTLVYGRQFDNTKTIYSKISSSSTGALVKFFRDELSGDDIKLLCEMRKMFHIELSRDDFKLLCEMRKMFHIC